MANVKNTFILKSGTCRISFNIIVLPTLVSMRTSQFPQFLSNWNYHFHCTKVPCFVCRKQPFRRNNMVGGCRVNNPLNIIISNMLTLLLLNKEHHNILSNHSSCSIFLTIILFIFALSFSLFQC